MKYLVLFFLFYNCYAAATFGLELTFTNSQVKAASKPYEVNSKFSSKLQKRWCKNLNQSLKSDREKVVFFQDKYGVRVCRKIFSNGWWYQISLDPGVIEIQTAPSTHEQLLENRQNIEEIYETAKKFKLAPHYYRGGGHIHIGYDSAFQGNFTAFLNFLSDALNHQYVFSRLLNYCHSHNAIVLGETGYKNQALVAKLIAQTRESGLLNVESFSDELSKIYSRNLAHPGESKYSAFNVDRMKTDSKFPDHEKTLEVRALRPQQTPDDIFLLTDLFNKKINYFMENPEEVHFTPLHYSIEYSTRFCTSNFLDYLRPVELDYKEYLPLIAPVEDDGNSHYYEWKAKGIGSFLSCVPSFMLI